jgi:multiple sugar transport system permease protein
MARASDAVVVSRRTSDRVAGRGRVRLGRVLLYAALIIVALLFIIPLIWMVSTAFKREAAVFTDTGIIPQQPTLENFERILQAGGDTPVMRWLVNSIIVAAVGTLLTVLLTSLSAYAFARIDFRGKTALFSLLVTTLLLPGVMFLVPQYLIVNIITGTPLRAIAGYNTYGALMLPGLAGVFGVFFLRQFFTQIPIELEEAAYVDGANRFRTFFSVILPISGPAIATLAVISFLAYWNDYLWPLISCQGGGCTLTPGLRNLQGQFTFEYGLLMAGAVLAAIPVLTFYVLAQRWVVQAVTASGIKG